MNLLVIVEDRISDWEVKGEILDGYFNPADGFETVAVLSLLSDRPQTQTLQRLCGGAKAEFSCVEIDRKRLFLSTAGLRTGLLEAQLTVKLAQAVSGNPNVIRAYGDGLAAVAASLLASELKVPYSVSLHATRDPDIERRFVGWRDRIWRRAIRPAVDAALRGADAVIAVYAPILDFLTDGAAAHSVVVPNVVGVTSRPNIVKRSGGRLRAVWISRHIPGRDARPLLEALALVPNVELTLFGEGPLLEATIRYAKSRGVTDRVRFVPSIENWRLCACLPEFDVLLVNSAYREMPKPVMEAALSGLPIVANRLPATDSPEYSSIPAILVEGSPRSYATTLKHLSADAHARNELARRTLDAAWMQWDPATVARRNADLLIGLAHGDSV